MTPCKHLFYEYVVAPRRVGWYCSTFQSDLTVFWRKYTLTRKNNFPSQLTINRVEELSLERSMYSAIHLTRKAPSCSRWGATCKPRQVPVYNKSAQPTGHRPSDSSVPSWKTRSFHRGWEGILLLLLPKNPRLKLDPGVNPPWILNWKVMTAEQLCWTEMGPLIV